MVVSHKALIEEELEAQKKEIMIQARKRSDTRRYGQEHNLLRRIHRPGRRRRTYPYHRPQLGPREPSGGGRTARPETQTWSSSTSTTRRNVSPSASSSSRPIRGKRSTRTSRWRRGEGKVVMMYDYGAFIEIAPGVEVSSTYRRVVEPAPAFGTGLHEDSDEVEAVILNPRP